MATDVSAPDQPHFTGRRTDFSNLSLWIERGFGKASGFGLETRKRAGGGGEEETHQPNHITFPTALPQLRP